MELLKEVTDFAELPLISLEEIEKTRENISKFLKMSQTVSIEQLTKELLTKKQKFEKVKQEVDKLWQKDISKLKIDDETFERMINKLVSCEEEFEGLLKKEKEDLDSLNQSPFGKDLVERINKMAEVTVQLLNLVQDIRWDIMHLQGEIEIAKGEIKSFDTADEALKYLSEI